MSTPSSAADIRVTPAVEHSSYVCLVLPKEVGEPVIAVRYSVHPRQSIPSQLHTSMGCESWLQFCSRGHGSTRCVILSMHLGSPCNGQLENL